MASLFTRLDTAAQRVHDQVFGELFTHKPKTRAANVNAPWVDDTSRTQRTITAIYTERDVPEDLPESIDVREDRRWFHLDDRYCALRHARLLTAS